MVMGGVWAKPVATILARRNPKPQDSLVLRVHALRPPRDRLDVPKHDEASADTT